MDIVLRHGSVRQLGGKAHSLAKLEEGGFPVPPWFVVSPRALEQMANTDQLRILRGPSRSSDLLALFEALVMPEAVTTQLRNALTEISPDGSPVAVRSSAVDEDGAVLSFAGQLESFLDVPFDQVAKRVVEVWRSGFSERILQYRREHGLSLPPPVPAVLIQKMVRADRAGVAFSADPVSGRRTVVVVSAVEGLADRLVSGEVDGDTYRIDREGRVIERTLVTTSKQVLSDDAAIRVAALTRNIAGYLARAQDVEWAMEGASLYVVQSRPVTSLALKSDPDSRGVLFDNSNIVESYSGITTPLTFSFARRIYEEVYRQFCRAFSVSEVIIADEADTFRRMLGLVRGRVYYNLPSWYRMLALLPGFAFNRRFMEQMMGVREGIPDRFLPSKKTPSLAARAIDFGRLCRSIIGLVGQHCVIDRTIRRFHRRLDRALGAPEVSLDLMRTDELVDYYQSLERQLITRWDAPLVNDFLAMIFHGVLRSTCESWIASDPNLHNDLIMGGGEIISAEPARLLNEMAALVSTDPNLAKILREGSSRDIERALADSPQMASTCERYLTKFGDRCLDELKLETLTLQDDPTLLWRSIGELALTHSPSKSDQGGRMENAIRGAEARAGAALAKHPVRRALFSWILKNARRRVRDRENLRFERTRLFGRVRRIFVEVGKRFYEMGVLDNPRDIFYLEATEILGFVDGLSTCTDLRALAALRRVEFDRYGKEAPPAQRFETHGAVYYANSYTEESPTQPIGSDGLRGLGCCPGVVRARARVVLDPRGAAIERGTILVAERTDPGWILLFPSAAGLLVERGSLLSHSAIVARELGIPAVVSLPGLTRWIRDGDLVELDGSTGVVRKIGEDGA